MLGRSPPFERRVYISHWSHTHGSASTSTHNTKAGYPLQWGPHSQGTTLCVHLATAASRESNQPKWCGQTMAQYPALGPSTHLHEMLLHVGCKVAQDTHLSLQLLRDGRHREHQVFAVGRVVMYSPGREQSTFWGCPPWCRLPSRPRGFPETDQPHSQCSPVVGGKCHVRAVVEEDPNAAVGELVAKTILVGIIHPLAHPDKVLMVGQGSWVFLRCWRREEVSSTASPCLSHLPRGNRALQQALAPFIGCYCTPSRSHAFIPWGWGCTAPYPMP